MIRACGQKIDIDQYVDRLVDQGWIVCGTGLVSFAASSLSRKNGANVKIGRAVS
jgi:hypothetical protein